MSKIGKQPVTIPDGVTVKVEDLKIDIFGPKGNFSFQFRPEIAVEITGDKINVTRKSESKFAKSLHGLTRSLIANMIKGVTVGHQKVLEIIGVGYRATKQGENLILNIGYSHPVVITPASGVQIETKENKVIISGADKALVGEIAARIRRVRPPEPYKGKGIKYTEEVIRRKAGKTVKAAQSLT
jgi:large subunit ribosomal protein L6